jgi:hypothetical protein
MQKLADDLEQLQVNIQMDSDPKRIDRDIGKLIASLHAAPEAADAGEPVAWRYRWKIDGEWTNWRCANASAARQRRARYVFEWRA